MEEEERKRISANAFNLAYKNTKKRKDMGEVDAPGAGALTLRRATQRNRKTEIFNGPSLRVARMRLHSHTFPLPGQSLPISLARGREM